ncbi:MAG: diacylglycerol kinase [Lentisphaerae bacterium]|jgi:diacylglycerol kinase (ATP)|nr:diacylglycerol kinase [Lentisphaerota bacterium]MBT5613157.1 diacylglycerol kinase [Lentisphaerota bacterium]MBT7061941.1 diacylglycerol kinase [Lentisphaerota bacterium]MBT7844551.1 diacylglycerol kinase [Lentisphaerota bacterium]
MDSSPTSPEANTARARRKGIGRVVNATRCSLAGLRATFRHEAAFRQEIALGCLTLPLLLFLAAPPVFKLAVLGAYCGVLTTELLNSAIEKVTDRASPGLHPLAKQAKDMASAAVLVSLVGWIIAWAFTLAASCPPVVLPPG